MRESIHLYEDFDKNNSEVKIYRVCDLKISPHSTKLCSLMLLSNTKSAHCSYLTKQSGLSFLMKITSVLVHDRNN